MVAVSLQYTSPSYAVFVLRVCFVCTRYGALCLFALLAPRWPLTAMLAWATMLPLGFEFFAGHRRLSLLWEVLKLANPGIYRRRSAPGRKVRDSNLNGLAPEHIHRAHAEHLRATGYGRQEAHCLFLALATHSIGTGASVIQRGLPMANGLDGLRVQVPDAFPFAPASSRDWVGLN
jgi:hypothetical protein